MKGSTGLVALAAALGFPVLQSPLALATNSQQDKMTTCNADATSKGLKGDERKAYMQTCLSRTRRHRRPRATASRKR